jgi:hypothetical protein
MALALRARLSRLRLASGRAHGLLTGWVAKLKALVMVGRAELSRLNSLGVEQPGAASRRQRASMARKELTQRYQGRTRCC